MFAQHVTLQLKPGVVRQFPRSIGKQIVSLLRMQKGFLEELVLIAPNQIEMVAISLWEEREHAEKYNRDVYPEIMKVLDRYVEGIPVVNEFEVQFATIPVFKKLAVAVTI